MLIDLSGCKDGGNASLYSHLLVVNPITRIIYQHHKLSSSSSCRWCSSPVLLMRTYHLSFRCIVVLVWYVVVLKSFQCVLGDALVAQWLIFGVWCCVWLGLKAWCLPFIHHESWNPFLINYLIVVFLLSPKPLLLWFSSLLFIIMGHKP